MFIISHIGRFVKGVIFWGKYGIIVAMLKRWYFWLLMVVVLVVTAFLTVICGLFFATPVIVVGGDTGKLIGMELEPVAEDPLKPVHVLLMGHGGAGHSGGGLADTMIVAQVIPRQQQVNLFSIPRDLWVELPFPSSAGGKENLHAKVNTTLAIGNSERQYSWRPSAYTGEHGGGELAKEVVGQIMGQKIDYYVAVDFSGFVKVIETIAGKNGLSVDVPYSFVDEFYPIEGKEDDPCDFSEEQIASMSAELSGYELEQQFTCRYERLAFSAGKQTIAPEELLKFVRSRHSGTNGGDFGRSQRQQVVIEALKKKILSPSMITKIPELASQVLKYVKTDLDTTLISNVLLAYENLDDFTITSYVITNKNLLKDGRSADRQYILLPRVGEDNYREIQGLVEYALEASGEASLDLYLEELDVHAQALEDARAAARGEQD